MGRVSTRRRATLGMLGALVTGCDLAANSEVGAPIGAPSATPSARKAGGQISSAAAARSASEAVATVQNEALEAEIAVLRREVDELRQEVFGVFDPRTPGFKDFGVGLALRMFLLERRVNDAGGGEKLADRIDRLESSVSMLGR